MDKPSAPLLTAIKPLSPGQTCVKIPHLSLSPPWIRFTLPFPSTHFHCVNTSIYYCGQQKVVNLLHVHARNTLKLHRRVWRRDPGSWRQRQAGGRSEYSLVSHQLTRLGYSKHKAESATGSDFTTVNKQPETHAAHIHPYPTLPPTPVGPRSPAAGICVQVSCAQRRKRVTGDSQTLVHFGEGSEATVFIGSLTLWGDFPRPPL